MDWLHLFRTVHSDLFLGLDPFLSSLFLSMVGSLCLLPSDVSLRCGSNQEKNIYLNKIEPHDMRLPLMLNQLRFGLGYKLFPEESGDVVEAASTGVGAPATKHCAGLHKSTCDHKERPTTFRYPFTSLGLVLVCRKSGSHHNHSHSHSHNSHHNSHHQQQQQPQQPPQKQPQPPPPHHQQQPTATSTTRATQSKRSVHG